MSISNIAPKTLILREVGLSHVFDDEVAGAEQRSCEVMALMVWKRRRRLVAKMHAFVNPNDLRFVVDEKSSNYQEASRLGCSADVWLRLLYQVDTNSYHTWTDRSRLLDTKILLPTCMLLNHSCDPNVRMTLRKNGSASIRAMRDITCGEELTICYNDDWVDADYAERSKHAASGWGFSCECKRCKRETSLVVYEEKKSQF